MLVCPEAACSKVLDPVIAILHRRANSCFPNPKAAQVKRYSVCRPSVGLYDKNITEDPREELGL